MNRLSRDGQGRWHKVLGSDRAFQQEATAYQRVVPMLPVRAPRLLRADPAQRLLVLSALEGSPPVPSDAGVWRQAGEALAALHAVPMEETDPLPLADALAQRWDAVMPQARRLVGDKADAAREAFGRLGGERRWCHRDYAPHNWLVHEGVLGVLDWEHCRPDHPLADLARLPWLEDDGWSDAFEAGYGPVDRGGVHRWAWLHALQTWTWGVRHSQPAFVASGRRWFAALDGGWRPVPR